KIMIRLTNLFIAILGGIALIFFTACGQKPAASFERPPAPVTVSAAVAQDVPIYIDAVGKTIAQEVVSIRPQVSGRITQILFADGAELKKGQILFTVDERPYSAQLHSAQAELAQRQAQLQYAKGEWSRAEDLVAKDFISKQDY